MYDTISYGNTIICTVLVYVLKCVDPSEAPKVNVLYNRIYTKIHSHMYSCTYVWF